MHYLESDVGATSLIHFFVCSDILDLREIQQDMAQMVEEQGGDIDQIGN